MSLVCVDWGTSSFRAVLLGPDGRIMARVTRPDDGMLAMTRAGDHSFERVLRASLADLLGGDAPPPIVLSGMVGSKQGWAEAPYAPCPCGPADLAARWKSIPCAGLDVSVIPGCSADAAAADMDVMRGEETQLMGLVALEGLGAGEHIVVLPGTHTKVCAARQRGRGSAGRSCASAVCHAEGWRHPGLQDVGRAGVGGGGAMLAERGRRFMTGEIFGLLVSHSILRLSVSGAPEDDLRLPAFTEGVVMGFGRPVRHAVPGAPGGGRRRSRSRRCYIWRSWCERAR